MDFSLSSEHEILRSSIKEFVDKEVISAIKDYDLTEDFFPPLSKMAEMGLLGICFPEEYDGSGMDYLALAIACEELERGDTSLRVVMSVHVGLISCAIYQWGTEDQKRYFLSKLCKGEKIGTFGLTEPCCGSDVGNIRTCAVKEGDHYIITGQKNWISMANKADYFLIIARTDERKSGVGGLTAFIVDRNMPGVETREIKNKLGVRAGDTGEIFLDNVKVPEFNRIGNDGEGFKVAMSAIDCGRFTVAAGSLGIIKAAIESSISYCHNRTVSGKEIGKLQLIQEHIAYMQASYDTSQLLVFKVAWMKNKGLRNTRETSMAKWIATTGALDAANRAIQIHGAYGYSSDYPVERLWRNVRGSCIYEGTTEIHKLIQASYVLGYRKDKPLRCELPPFDR